MTSLFFDDLEVGRFWTSPGRTITESDVASFAGLTGDFFPLHTDETYAARTRFGSRIAHGLLGLTFAHGLMWARTGELDESVIAFLGIEEWTFHAPIRFGDTIRCRYEVVERTPSRSPALHGTVVFHAHVENQRGEAVQSGRKRMLIARREQDWAAKESDRTSEDLQGPARILLHRAEKESNG